MATDDRVWLLIPRQIRTLPVDLRAVLVYLLATNLVVFVPVLNETPLRVVLGLPLVLFVPGYTFIAALFPEAGTSPTEESDVDTGTDDADTDTSGRTTSRGIDGIERVALSFGLSIAIVPLIGLVLNFTPWGIRLTPILVSLSGFVVASTWVAGRRRLALPAEERFRVPYRQWLAAGRTELFEPETRADLLLNVLLVASVLLAAGSVAYAVSVPKQGEAFTEFYLLTEDDQGELVADGYPTEFTVGEGKPLVVGIGNHEHEPVDYTVVSELQRVEVQNNSTRVLDERELSRFSTTLAANETTHRNLTVTPTMTGDRLRLVYLLYKGQPAAQPSTENAYREVHLWVNVSSN